MSKILYSKQTIKSDFDFIVDKIQLRPKFSDWKVNINKFGNRKISRNDIEIDLIPLSNVLSIKRRRLNPSIENYLSGTPLTIQSIAYNIKTEKLIGDIGAKAIRTRTIEINNQIDAEFSARLYNRTIEEMISKLKKSLDF